MGAVGILIRFGCALWVLLPAGDAVAQSLEAGAPPLAEQRYRSGRTLYKAGQLDQAAAEFATALDLFPKSAILAYNVGRVEERRGRFADAIRGYALYLELAPEAKDHAEVQALVRSLRARLEGTRARVVFTSVPAAAEVFLDGAAKPSGRTPLTLSLDPGEHAVRFTHDAHLDLVETLAVEAGKPGALAVELVPAASGTATTGSESAGDWRPVAGYTALGLGVAAVAVGVVFHLDAADAHAEGDSLKSDDPDRRDELNDRIGQGETLAFVGYGVGAALIAGGAAPLWWPAEDGAVALGPGSAWVQGRW